MADTDSDAATLAAGLLAQPDEVLLRIFARLPLATQHALAARHPRFAALFNEPRLWRARLEHDYGYALPEAWRAAVAAQAAALGATDARAASDPGWTASSAKRQYELLRRNESTLVRAPASFRALLGAWRLRAAAFARVDGATLLFAHMATAESATGWVRLVGRLEDAAGGADRARVQWLTAVPARPPLEVRYFVATRPDQLEVLSVSATAEGAGALAAPMSLWAMSTRAPYAHEHTPLAPAPAPEISAFMGELADADDEPLDTGTAELSLATAAYLAGGHAAVVVYKTSVLPLSSSLPYVLTSVHVLVRARGADAWRQVAALSPAHDLTRHEGREAHDIYGTEHEHAAVLVGVLDATSFLMLYGGNYLVYEITTQDGGSGGGSGGVVLRHVVPSRFDVLSHATVVGRTPVQIGARRYDDNGVSSDSRFVVEQLSADRARVEATHVAPAQPWALDKDVVTGTGHGPRLVYALGEGRALALSARCSALFVREAAAANAWRVLDSHCSARVRAPGSPDGLVEEFVFSPDMRFVVHNGTLGEVGSTGTALVSCEMCGAAPRWREAPSTSQAPPPPRHYCSHACQRAYHANANANAAASPS